MILPRSLLKTILLFSLLVFLAGCGTTPPDTLTPDISSDDLQAMIAHLASDAMEGRRAGTRGFDYAAEYAAQVFEQIGCEQPFLDERGKPTWFQPVPLVHIEYGRKNGISIRTVEGDSSFGRGVDGLVFIAPGQQAPPDAPITPIFVGYGIHEPDLGWDDFEGLDLRGKVVVVLQGYPDDIDATATLPDTLVKHYEGWSGLGFGLSTRKRIALAEQEVAGVLVLPSRRLLARWGTLRYHEHWFDLLPEIDDRDQPADPPYPIVVLPREAVRHMFKNRDFNPLSRTGTPKRGPMNGIEITWRYDVKRTAVLSHNIGGFVPGFDPELAGQVVVSMAHLDHLGMREGGIYNGANDNASGSVAVLEAAGAFADQPGARSSLFLLTTAEEVGFWGSLRFVQDAPLPLDSIRAVVNFDEAGILADFNRVEGIGDSIFAVPLKVGARTHSLEEPWFKLAGSRGTSIFKRSDHYNFARRGIPSLFLWTGHFPEYHSTVDDLDRIDPVVLYESTLLLEGLLRELTNQQ
ncbi:M28 family peptidase [bacterium]|nr:M28 family peptidase [bacterium]